jgi:hypothetical protein
VVDVEFLFLDFPLHHVDSQYGLVALSQMLV